MKFLGQGFHHFRVQTGQTERRTQLNILSSYIYGWK